MKALILVDIQNDFLPGGALAVPNGDQVIPVANAVQSKFEVVVASRDWHPRSHGSFAANHPGKKPGDHIVLNGLDQILWPVHCVQNDKGAEIADKLNVSRVERYFMKGTNPEVDSYSAFFDNARKCDTGLGNYLKQKGVTEVYLLGLATDYCVKFSALDAQSLGFKTFLIQDGCRGVNLQPGDSEKALEEMKAAGVNLISAQQL